MKDRSIRNPRSGEKPAFSHSWAALRTAYGRRDRTAQGFFTTGAGS